MKSLVRIFLAAVVTLGVASSAMAQPQPRRFRGQPQNPLARLLDRNGDGEISAEEIDAAPRVLKTLDRNEDGQVTRDEMRAAFQRMARPGTGQSNANAGSRGSRPGSTGSETLERAGLKVGQTLPELTILDGDGQPFPMAHLRGKYSVLVFGCLT